MKREARKARDRGKPSEPVSRGRDGVAGGPAPARIGSGAWKLALLARKARKHVAKPASASAIREAAGVTPRDARLVTKVLEEVRAGRA